MNEQEQVSSRGSSRRLRLSLKALAVWLAMVAISGAGLAYVSGLPVLGAMAIVAGAFIVTGLVAEVEDRSPSGFLREQGTTPTPAEAPPGDALYLDPRGPDDA